MFTIFLDNVHLKNTMAFKALLVATIAFMSVHALYDKDLIKPIQFFGATYCIPSPSGTSPAVLPPGRFIKRNNVAMRIDFINDDVIIAFPRFKSGVPATLAKLNMGQNGCDACLVPFPNWAAQEIGKCNALQNIIDTSRDDQNVLWLLDSGVINTMESPLRTCPPKVVGINMVTGSIVASVNLGPFVAPTSNLNEITCEMLPNGRKFVYVSDAGTNSIIVVDVSGSKVNRVVLPRAILGAANRPDTFSVVVTKKPYGDNVLVFTYLSGDNVYGIKTAALRMGAINGQITNLGRKSKKIVLLGADPGSGVFFRYDNGREMYRWDSNFPFRSEYFTSVWYTSYNLKSVHTSPDLKRGMMRVLDSNFDEFLQNAVGDCGALHQINAVA